MDADPRRVRAGAAPRAPDLVIRQKLHSRFGPHALEPGLFYRNEPALRFELSRAGPPVDLFAQAFDRARELLDHLFGDAGELTVVLAADGAGPLVRHLDLFRALRRCGVEVARPFECWTERGAEDGESDGRTLIAFTTGRSSLARLAWGALARDIGIEPHLPCRVFLADLETGVLAHPYDDRGMDVIAADPDRLRGIFQRFHAYLLAYDLPRMEAFFPTPRA